MRDKDTQRRLCRSHLGAGSSQTRAKQSGALFRTPASDILTATLHLTKCERQMESEVFQPKKRSALDACYQAQKLAFAPVLFKCLVELVKTGLLEEIERSEPNGLSPVEAAQKSRLSEYACQVLMETALSAEVLVLEEGRYRMSDVGYFFLRDKMTLANLNFVNDVCYRPLDHLGASLKAEKPEGLKEFGSWKTVYEGLAHLPPAVQKSWFEFDHYYSDSAFHEALPFVFDRRVSNLADFGGNTGKWAEQCLNHNPEVKITIVDLPGQALKAKERLESHLEKDRVSLHHFDFLAGDSDSLLKDNRHKFDAVWMSQFLVCFSEPEIVKILKLARTCLAPGGRIMILDTYWDIQKYDIAAFCLINTSPYFTTVANGNSKMFSLKELKKYCSLAELEIEVVCAHLGRAHSLISCTPAKRAALVSPQNQGNISQ